MKVSLQQEQLAKGLSVVGRGVASGARSTLPITSNILLATDEGRLRLSATDLEIGINMWLPAMVEEEGATTVPARLFTEFVNSLPGGRVDLAQVDEANTVAVSCARVKSNIRGMDADEFPLIPTVSEQPSAAVPADLLRSMITSVVFAASKDDARQVFMGVLATFAGDKLTFAAADGYRLSLRSATLSEPSAGDFSVIIPARTLAELGRILPEGDERVEVTVTPNRSQVLFHTASLDLVSRLIEGQYVNYQQIIPQKYAVRAVVNTAEWSKATRTASFFARDSNDIVHLTIEPGADDSPGSLTIKATAADVGDNVSQIDAVVEGGPLSIAFNVRYIAEVLGVISSGQVALELNGPTQPGVVKPQDGTDFLHVMMPLSIPR
ncbi:MAG TPA: DNA polymerase III subunit beta [Chloroflexota bacterium]|nr:DNA polymerase III subunit beta [Chloroflexota bacterium]